MTANLTFANGFGSGQPVGAWMYANDTSGSSGWVSVGSWQPPPGVVVSISPQNVTLLAGQSRQFTAQVTGTSNTNVTWSAPPDSSYGTISSTGLYTAPSVISPSLSDTIYATSVADSTKSASMRVNLQSSFAPTLDSVVSNGISGNRVVVTFSVTDHQGINSIEPFFTAGANSYGPKNGTNPCHMKYFPTSNQIYLDGDSGGSTWTAGSSWVGSGGTGLSNSFCTVHAGSSQTGSYSAGQLALSVDVEFPTVPQTIFVAADDVQGAIANFQWFSWWPSP
jgi:hypothetical protein